jgi:hypothetical protein
MRFHADLRNGINPSNRSGEFPFRPPLNNAVRSWSSAQYAAFHCLDRDYAVE